ncbi:hypothetical protein I6G64_17915 [Serratia plymuthica]|uniref:Uncharacterized protein n=1 Tax=Serratia plymuthica TaxID=82996 RepID=A0A7T2SPX5_SERPL|nr:hypothetical protein [Serratia plymuthica]QPS19444.1 hypothetical protein I6G64_17915 [Serratia plymuthica]QPS61156.1 hypothetical protein I6G52_13710 [Serratia plymuthica]
MQSQTAENDNALTGRTPFINGIVESLPVVIGSMPVAFAFGLSAVKPGSSPLENLFLPNPCGRQPVCDYRPRSLASTDQVVASTGRFYRAGSRLYRSKSIIFPIQISTATLGLTLKLLMIFSRSNL